MRTADFLTMFQESCLFNDYTLEASDFVIAFAFLYLQLFGSPDLFQRFHYGRHIKLGDTGINCFHVTGLLGSPNPKRLNHCFE